MEPTRLPTLPRFLAWTAILALTVYLVLIGGGWPGIYSAGLRASRLVLIATVLAIWGMAAVRIAAWRPGSACLPGTIAALVAMAVATAASRLPQISIEYLAWATLLASLYLLLVRL